MKKTIITIIIKIKMQRTDTLQKAHPTGEFIIVWWPCVASFSLASRLVNECDQAGRETKNLIYESS